MILPKEFYAKGSITRQPVYAEWWLRVDEAFGMVIGYNVDVIDFESGIVLASYIAGNSVYDSQVVVHNKNYAHTAHELTIFAKQSATRMAEEWSKRIKERRNASANKE